MSYIQILTTFAWICSVVLTFYMAYFPCTAIFSLKKSKSIYQEHPPKTRFAVLIAARNEEAVIGSLVESLMAQQYPRELYDVIVIPNNCTDDTAGAALRAGAKILECAVPVKSKGEVLTFTIDNVIAENRYDNIVIFDADNLVHPDFLKEMNNAICSGVRVAQGYRDSKNPGDTLMSGCYSIYYLMVNHFYSCARGNIGLNAVINGSGFMVDLKLLEEWGGWHTVTMTEDIEFTAQCALKGEKVCWIPKAITFDEQPLTFSQSWKQRKRWSTGLIQCMENYTGKLVRSVFKGNFRSLDSLLFFIAPIVQVLWLASLTFGFAFYMFGLDYGFFPETGLFYRLFFSLSTSFAGVFLTAILSLFFSGKRIRPMLMSAVYYWVFVMSWIPINLLCLVRRASSWEQIRHTRNISLSQLFANKS